MAANGVRAIFRKTLFRKTLLAIALLVNCSIATAPVWAAGQTEAHTNAYPYYVEFRAAVDGLYGHSYIAYGRLNTLGQPASAAYADIHPIGGFTSMVLGHFFALAASTSPEKDTLGHKIASRFRLPLTAAAYGRLQSVIARVRPPATAGAFSLTTATTSLPTWRAAWACARRRRYRCLTRSSRCCRPGMRTSSVACRRRG